MKIKDKTKIIDLLKEQNGIHVDDVLKIFDLRYFWKLYRDGVVVFDEKTRKYFVV